MLTKYKIFEKGLKHIFQGLRIKENNILLKSKNKIFQKGIKKPL